jgi:GNAT superfamily N-acetyltransferase
MTPAIVRARRADATQLTRISRAAKRHWGYPERLLRLWRRDLTVTPGFIDRHPVYHALHRGRVVGFYAIGGTGRVRELEHMWVHPRRMGAGVGRALFAHLVKRLRAMEVRRLDVASDPNAEGFYRRMGARRVGTIASTPAGRTLPLLRFTLRGSRSDARRRPR